MFSSRKSSIVEYECTDENSQEGPSLRDAPPLSNARSSSNMPESDSIESSDDDSQESENKDEDKDEDKDKDEDAVIYGHPPRSLLKEMSHDILIVLNSVCLCMIIIYMRQIMGIYEEQDLVLDKIMLALAVLLTFYATLSLGIFVLKHICRNDFTTMIGFREYLKLHILTYTYKYTFTAIIISGAVWYTQHYTDISTINMYFPMNGTSIIPEIVNITSYPINSTNSIPVSNIVQSVVNTTTDVKTNTSWDTFWETFVSDN